MEPAEAEAGSFASGGVLLKDPGCTCCSLAQTYSQQVHAPFNPEPRRKQGQCRLLRSKVCLL